MGLIQVRDRNGDRKVCGLKSYLIVALNAERESRILVYKTCLASFEADDNEIYVKNRKIIFQSKKNFEYDH